jgi:hypothetical protein
MEWIYIIDISGFYFEEYILGYLAVILFDSYQSTGVVRQMNTIDFFG